MRICGVPWPIVALGVTVLLSGCAGDQAWPYAARPFALQPAAPQPDMPQPRSAARVPARPAPAPSAPALSQDDKERLFQQFQDSESRKAQADTTEAAAP